MKCSVCRKTIPAARRKLQPNVKTCSGTCSGIRQGGKADKRSKSYRARVRKNLGEIRHVPLVPGTELLKVRNGHVVGLRQPEGGWELVVVVRATHGARATHVCPASAWEPGLKATSANRLSGGTIVVLPPEWAEDQGLALAAELAETRFFSDLEELRQTLTR